MLKFYSDKGNYEVEQRYHLNTPAKAFWNERSQEERRQVYGNWVDLYQYEPEISKADVCLLTYHWPYYINHGRVAEAIAEVGAAKEAGKPMIVFSGSDYPARMPFEDVILFESSGYRSDEGYRYHSAIPSFLNDYINDYCRGELVLREKQNAPVVGFCGQAETNVMQTAWRSLRRRKRDLFYRLGLSKWEPPPFETTSFRAKVLKAFEKPGIQTNYLARKQYQAGKSGEMTSRSQEKVDFVNNVLGSDYTLCMRGGGNFSVRFYETLCLGRIPIFIDSDCLLPFQDVIDYKAIFPWIDMKDLPNAADILLDFHSKLSNEEFKALQVTCRYLWLDHMTPDGFYRDLLRMLNFLVKESMILS